MAAWTLIPGLCGCGSLTRLTGGGSDAAARRSVSWRRLVATYVATVNPHNGSIIFAPEPPGSPDPTTGGRGIRHRRGVTLQATRFGPGDRLALSGSANYAAGIVSGDVTISSTNRFPFFDTRAVILSISSTSVTVRSPSGTTTLPGASAPYFDHGTVSSGSPSLRTWQFNNPSGVNFSFRVQLYANVWQYAVGDGGTIGGICFIDANMGWAVGAGGKILKSTDGGSTWAAQNAGTTRNLNDVFFLDANRGWIVGDSGTILATSDGGRSWQVQSSPVTVTLNGVRFADASTGCVAGNTDTVTGLSTVLRTGDGGATWTQVTSGLTDGNLFALDLTTGGGTQLTAVGEGALIVRSTDAGASWTIQDPPAALSSFVNLQAVDFVSGSRGWAAGSQGTILSTNDGGATWAQQSSGTSSATLLGVAFTGNSVGWVVGQSGLILKTTNGGSNWSSQSNPAVNDLWAAAALSGDTSHAWTVGAAGALLYTTAGGSPWVSVSASARDAINAVDFVDSTRGWVVGNNGLMQRTLNGGTSWSPMTSNGRTLTAVDFVNDTNGWSVGVSNTILRTANGGGSWVQLPAPPDVSSAAFSGVKFINTSTGWIVGNGTNGFTPTGTPFVSGLYLRTFDGGNSWEVKPDPSGTALPPLNAVDFATDTTGWIVGSSGKILKTTNGGDVWTSQTSGVTQSLLAVKAIDATHACAVGQNGRILRTDDGVNWTIQSSPVTVDLNAVDFVDRLRGWIVGSTRSVSEGGISVTRETVLRTTDGGATWSTVDTFSNVRLTGVRFVDADDGWMVGANGLIKRYH